MGEMFSSAAENKQHISCIFIFVQDILTNNKAIYKSPFYSSVFIKHNCIERQPTSENQVKIFLCSFLHGLIEREGAITNTYILFRFDHS